MQVKIGVYELVHGDSRLRAQYVVPVGSWIQDLTGRKISSDEEDENE